MESHSFPRKSALWTGAILNGIAHAIKGAEDPVYSSLSEWDGDHYFVNGFDGRMGAITFEHGHRSHDGHLVGVFFFSESARSPFVQTTGYDLEQFFRGCPGYQRSLADRAALPYLQMEDNGKVVQLVTTAFWDAGEYLTAADTWTDVFANGCHLIEVELLEDHARALAAVQDNCDMSAEQMEFVSSLFKKKIDQPAATIQLTRTEVEWLELTARDTQGIKRLRRSFAGLGIIAS